MSNYDFFTTTTGIYLLTTADSTQQPEDPPERFNITNFN